ncbi:hypothetical protein KKG45_12330 [bacterium]|nr:hypothetical protein [bacterium]MBU1074024.1 hypothetical protein [bacterium]MBU1676587.1 hypothetical protein [bacterium]
MRDRIHMLPLVFSLLLMAGLMLIQGDCIQEDAFISFRYAANLLDGHGLTYNPGERVEGYTNFLWTVMLAGAMALGADPAAAARTMGFVAALVLCGVVIRTARLARPGNRWAGLVAVALLAGTPGFAAEAVQGLETVWFALLVTVGVVTAVRALECRVPRRAAGLSAWSALALILAALTRPEGVGVLLLVVAGAWYVSRRGATPCRRWLAIAAGAFVLVYLPYWWLRFDYYGYPLPNTFYAKTGGGLHHLLRGLAYLGRFLLHHPAVAALSLAAAPSLRALRERDVRPAIAVPCFVTCGYLIYVALVGGDFKETWRFVLPVLPLWALVLDAWAVGAVARRGPASSRVAWGLVAVAMFNALPSTPGTLRWSRHRVRDLERRTVCGEWLRDNAPPGVTLAIHSAGIVPFVSGLRTIDMWGLNDLHIAHRRMPGMGRTRPAGHEKSDYGYVFGLGPTYILPRGWAMVTDAPYRGLKGAMFPGVDAWVEYGERYRERHVPLPPAPGEAAPRYFNFVELSSSSE